MPIARGFFYNFTRNHLADYFSRGGVFRSCYHLISHPATNTTAGIVTSEKSVEITNSSEA